MWIVSVVLKQTHVKYTSYVKHKNTNAIVLRSFMTSNKGPFLAIWEHDLLISCSNNSLQARSLQAAIYICTLFQPYSKQMCPQWGSSTDHFIGQRYTWHSACLGILPGLLHKISESRHFLSAKEICANIQFEQKQLSECKGRNLRGSVTNVPFFSIS